MVEHPAVKACVWHRCKKPLTGRQEKFCSENCKNNFFVARRRRALKLMAVAYKGGKCAACGYGRCIEALTFHHVHGKDFGIAFKGYTRSWARVQAELDSCVLLCSNCHAETHAKQDAAASSGNGWVKNQVNSRKPNPANGADMAILSQGRQMTGDKVQRLERQLVPPKGGKRLAPSPRFRIAGSEKK